MKIEFKKNLTKSDQDGFGLLFEVNGKDLEVQVSRTFLGMFESSVENIDDLMESFRLDGMINSIDDLFSKEDRDIIKIDLDSDGLKIKGKIHYSPDDLKKFIAIKK